MCIISVNHFVAPVAVVEHNEFINPDAVSEPPDREC